MPETTRKRLWNTTILLPVFIPAFFFILLLVIGTASQPELAGELFASVLSYITNTFGWFYMLAVAIFLVFIVIVALSNGDISSSGPTMPNRSTAFPPGSPCCFPPATVSPCCSSVWLNRCCITPTHPLAQG